MYQRGHKRTKESAKDENTLWRVFSLQSLAAEVGVSNKMAKKWLTLVVHKFSGSDSTPSHF